MGWLHSWVPEHPDLQSEIMSTERNKRHLRVSFTFLWTLKKPRIPYFLRPALGPKTQNPTKAGKKAGRPLAESNSGGSHSPGNSPHLSHMFPAPHSNTRDRRGRARGARAPPASWLGLNASGPPGKRPGRGRPSFAVLKENDKVPSRTCGGLRGGERLSSGSHAHS